MEDPGSRTPKLTLTEEYMGAGGRGVQERRGNHFCSCSRHQRPRHEQRAGWGIGSIEARGGRGRAGLCSPLGRRWRVPGICHSISGPEAATSAPASISLWGVSAQRESIRENTPMLVSGPLTTDHSWWATGQGWSQGSALEGAAIFKAKLQGSRSG